MMEPLFVAVSLRLDIHLVGIEDGWSKSLRLKIPLPENQSNFIEREIYIYRERDRN